MSPDLLVATRESFLCVRVAYDAPSPRGHGATWKAGAARGIRRCRQHVETGNEFPACLGWFMICGWTKTEENRSAGEEKPPSPENGGVSDGTPYGPAWGTDVASYGGVDFDEQPQVFAVWTGHVVPWSQGDPSARQRPPSSTCECGRS